VIEKDNEEKFLRVSAGSNAQSVGSAIAHALYENPQVKIRAVGASAVNQAVKAIAIARGYVAPRGLDLIAAQDSLPWIPVTDKFPR